PRTGARALLATLAQLAPSRVLYISCHPGSLARDLGVLVHEHGFALAAAGVVDMFPHTAHVESLALLTAPPGAARPPPGAARPPAERASPRRCSPAGAPGPPRRSGSCAPPRWGGVCFFSHPPPPSRGSGARLLNPPRPPPPRRSLWRSTRR